MFVIIIVDCWGVIISSIVVVVPDFNWELHHFINTVLWWTMRVQYPYRKNSNQFWIDCSKRWVVQIIILSPICDKTDFEKKHIYPFPLCCDDFFQASIDLGSIVKCPLTKCFSSENSQVDIKKEIKKNVRLTIFARNRFQQSIQIQWTGL